MADTPNDTIGSWISRNFATGLVVLTLFGNIVGQWALLSDKARQIDAIQSKLIELVVRVSVLETKLEALREIVIDIRRDHELNGASLGDNPTRVGIDQPGE